MMSSKPNIIKIWLWQSFGYQMIEVGRKNSDLVFHFSTFFSHFETVLGFKVWL